MATKDEKERLSVLETKLSRANDDIKEIKDDVKEGFEMVGKKIDELPNTFYTRREATQLKWVLGTLIAICGAFGAVFALFIK